MSIERLKTILRMTDAEVIQNIIGTLTSSDSGYEVYTDDENFVFGIPTTDTICPVLLQAHVDTRRHASVDEPLILCTEYGVITNANGILGGDDRCGVAGILDIIERHTSKPFVLFTNYEETGGKGMKAFLKTGYLDKFVDHIYCVIALDRRGHNEYVYYSPTLPSKLTYFLAKLGYYEANGSYSDCYDLWMKHDIAHVNLSCGYGRQHTADEFVLAESYVSSILRADRLMQMIDEPFRVKERFTYRSGHGYSSIAYPIPKPADNAGQGTAALEIVGSEELASDDGPEYVQGTHIHSPVHMPPEAVYAYSAAPKCFVCARDDRPMEYDTKNSFFICETCKKQIIKHFDTVTVPNAMAYYDMLEEVRAKSREANRNLNKAKLKAKSSLPVCPGCGDNHHVIWSRKDIGFVCTSCFEYPSIDGYNGKFWVRGDKKIFVKTVNGKQMVLVTDLKGEHLLSSEELLKSSKLHQCAVCHEPHISCSCETIGKTRKVNVYVCPSCKQEALDTLLNDNLPPWDLD
jgi:hypothetical protein